jgi:ribose-phosphate pyrophosphokinase
VRGEDVFVVQSTSSPANDNMMELLVCLDALKRSSARRITAVLPYFGYARQDRKSAPRTPISAKLVANLITAAGANRVLTLDLHAGQIQGFFDIPVDHLYAAPVLIGYLRERGIENLTVVSPDVGGLKMSDAYAKALDAPLAIVGKRRVSATEVEAINVIGEVEGQDVLLVDDMTETAGTLCAAAELLKDHGAGKIYAGVSHGVLGEIGNQRLIDSNIEELITTDSTPMAKGEKVTVVSIAALLGEGIRRIENDESVTSLFDIVNK